MPDATDGSKVTVGTRVSPDVDEEIEAYQTQNDISKSEALRQLIAAGLERKSRSGEYTPTDATEPGALHYAAGVGFIGVSLFIYGLVFSYFSINLFGVTGQLLTKVGLLVVGIAGTAAVLVWAYQYLRSVPGEQNTEKAAA